MANHHDPISSTPSNENFHKEQSWEQAIAGMKALGENDVPRFLGYLAIGVVIYSFIVYVVIPIGKIIF